jgi:SAM-dependent methyltransferase
MKKMKFWYHRVFRRKGLYAFLSILPSKCSVLDVGCGNDSSYNIKTCFPEFNYTGIDIGDYNQTKPMLADEYIITTSDNFAKKIGEIETRFDAVISSHNLEHCDDRDKTLQSMMHVVRPGGFLYISFPCQESIHFPRRKRTLNYFDDPTHQSLPPNFNDIVQYLVDNDFDLTQKIRRYRPILLFVIGLFQEPIAWLRKDNLQGTWSLYGFESIIWARKKR